MRGILKKSLVLVLAFSMILATSMQAFALTLQEQSYLSHLAPKTMPKSSTSYPAKLLVNVSAMILQANLEFRGSIGTNATLSDEEMLELLKQSLSGESSYKTLQDAVNDKTLVRELTEKLSFTQKDMDAIAANLRQILGVDELWDVVNGELPGYGKDDYLDMALDIAKDENPLNPKPGLSGMFISTLFVTWEEMQNDKEKYQDIIALSKANERLRNFYSAFGRNYRAFLVENGDWALTINAQDVADLTYNQMPGSKQLWTADIELNKSDGGFDSITGTYTGTFKLSMDADMLAFDDGYANFHAEYVSRAGGTQWYATGNEGNTSEIKLAYEIPNCQLNISLPPGVNRHFFEESIPSASLVQTEFTIQVDRTISVRSDTPDGYGYEIVNVIENDGVYAYNQTIGWVSRLGSGETYNNDGDNMSWPPDTRSGVTMTLVIDMLSN